MDDLNSKTIDEAAERLKDVVKRTPLEYSERLSKKYQAEVYLKREDLQKVRSFKIRGAYNRMSGLTEDEKKRGVVCASAGNHAQGVSFSCNAMKVNGVIFMPAITPRQKVEKVKGFGNGYVKIELIGNTYDESYAAAQEYCKENSMTFIHPFDDAQVMAGQGTVGKEIYEEISNLDMIIVPIGGGGLISGVSTYLKEKNSKVKVIGTEPDKAAGMKESLSNGKVITLDEISTFVDGAAVKTIGKNTFEVVKKNVDEVVAVPEGQVCTTMVELYQNEGIITEPAGALSVSTLDFLSGEIKGKKVVCIVSGGNNDILRYPEILERSLVYLGLKHYFVVEFAQKPGQLKNFLDNALGPNDDIVRFEYIKKSNKEKGPAIIGVELKSKEDYEPLKNRMTEIGLNFKELKTDDMLYNYLV